MRSIFRMFAAVAVGTLAAALLAPSVASAQGRSRAGSLEFILPVTYSPSTSFTGQGGSSAELNSDLGLGIGIGYNFNDHFQLGGLINWNTRSYNATLMDANGGTRNATGTLDSSTIALNAIYYFSRAGLTPFVSGAIGSTFIDTNIPNGAPTTGCWWDPWYGQICNTYTPTKTQTGVSYTAGVGVRAEVNRVLSLQGSYNRMRIDLSHETPELTLWRLDFVFRM